MNLRIISLVALVFLIASCVDDAPSNKVLISAKYGICGLTQLEKIATDTALVLKFDSTGAVLFRSMDSLQVAFLADMGCGTNHSEAYSLENDSTLKVEWTYSPGPVAGCACRKVVTVSASSKELPLNKIHHIDFNKYYIRF